MIKIKSSTVYELDKEDLRQVLASYLKVDDYRKVSFEFVEKVVSSDPMDRFPEVYGVSGIKITITE